MKLLFLFLLLFSTVSFSQGKSKSFSMLKNSFLKNGDSIKNIEHGDMVLLGKYRDRCIARRDLKENLRLDCRASLKRRFRKLKLPCFYNDKIYFHGQIIPVNPGVWVYYRGQVISLKPGLMLVCNNGKLESKEIRTPRIKSKVSVPRSFLGNDSINISDIESSAAEIDNRITDAHINLSANQISCFAERNENNRLNLDCVDNSRNRLRNVKMPCFYEDKVYPHGQIIPVSPGVWIVKDGFLVDFEPGRMLVCDDGELKQIEITPRL